MNQPAHLSISQVRTWLRCPRQWGYRYLSGYKEPPKWTMKAGTAMDDTLSAHNRGKIEGKGLNTSAATDFYRDRVRQVADQDGLPKNEEMSSVIDDGTKILPVYMKEVDPVINPVAVQKEIKREVDGVPMLGYIDLVRKAKDGHRIVSDYKFANRAPNKGTAAASLQLAFYQESEGDPSGHVDLIVLTRTKEARVLTDSHFVTDHDRSTVRRIVKQVSKGIASKVFPMASPENEWGNGPSNVCNPERCGWWNKCRGRVGGPEPIPGEIEV